MFRGLRVRLTIVCAVSTGLVLVGMAVASYLFSASQMQRQYEQSFRSSGVSVTSYMLEQDIISHTWLMQTEMENDVWIDVTTQLAALEYTGNDFVRSQIMSCARQIALQEHGLNEVRSPFDSQAQSAVFIMEADGSRFRVFLSQIPYGDTQRLVTVVKNTSSERQALFGLLLQFARTWSLWIDLQLYSGKMG